LQQKRLLNVTDFWKRKKYSLVLLLSEVAILEVREDGGLAFFFRDFGSGEMEQPLSALWQPLDKPTRGKLPMV